MPANILLKLEADMRCGVCGKLFEDDHGETICQDEKCQEVLRYRLMHAPYEPRWPELDWQPGG